MNPIPLSAPYSGENDLIPLIQLQNPFCKQITNFNLDDGNLVLRNGDSEYGSKTSFTILDLATYGVGTGEKLLTITDSGANISIYNNTTPGAPIGIYSVVATGDRNIQELYFNGYMFFFGESQLTPSAAGNLYYNGIAGGVAAYTYSTITPFGGNVFKERAYHIGYQSTKYGYTGIKAISGSVTEVDLAQIISVKAFLYCIVSIPGHFHLASYEGLLSDAIQCFIFNSGEVLVYNGNYPNLTGWGLISHFFIPAPVNYNAVIKVYDDTFIITKSSLISLRTLISGDVDTAINQGLSAPITNRWKQIFQSGLSFNGMKGIFDQGKQRIVITLKNYVDRTGAININDGMRLVYSFRTKSWTEHRVPLASSSFGYFGSSTYFGGNVLMAGQNSNKGGTMIMEGSSGFVDSQPDSATAIGYPYEVVSAPVADGRAYVQRAAGMDVILQSDLYTETSYNWIRDLGVASSDLQKIPFDQSSLIKTRLNLGMKGSYIQYRISGTTVAGKTVGYQLLGINYWQDPGTVTR